MTDGRQKSGLDRYLSIEIFACLCFAAASLCILYTHSVLGDRFTFSPWSARDFVRSFELRDNFQTCGPELTGRGASRIPGGLLHYVWALPLAFSSDPVVSHRFMLVLNFAGAVVLFCLLRRYWGCFSACFGTCVYLCAVKLLYPNIFHLWNPGFMPFFIICAYYAFTRLVMDEDVSRLRWFVFWMCCALQMHLSGLMPALAAALVVVLFAWGGVFAWRRLGRELLWALLAAVLVYSPYIAGEILNGFPNTGFMLAHKSVMLPGGAGFVLSRVPMTAFRIVCFFSGDWKSGVFGFSTAGAPFYVFAQNWFLPLLAAAFALWATAGAAAAVWKRRVKHMDAPQRLVLMPVFCALIMFPFFAKYVDWLYTNPRCMRYFFVLLPAYCILLAMAVRSVADRLYGMRKALGGIFIIAVSACALLQAWAAFACLRAYPGYPSLARDRGNLESVMDVTGWSVEEMAGRLAVSDTTVGLKTWGLRNSFDYVLCALALDGREFPGSGTGGRGAVYLVGGADLKDSDCVKKSLDECFLRQRVPDLRFERAAEIGRDLLVIYSRTAGRSFSTLSNRYLLTAEEALTMKHMSGMRNGTAKSIVLPDGDTRFLAFLGGNLYILFNLSPAQEGFTLSAHSNQLRGISDLSGFWDWAMIDGLKVDFKELSSGRVQTVEVVNGMAGCNGILAPYKVGGVALPAGRYEASMRTRVIEDYLSMFADRKATERYLRIGAGHEYRKRPAHIVLGRIIVNEDGKPVLDNGGGAA